MKRYLLYALAGTMLFAGSATLSLWLQQQARPKAEGDAGQAERPAKEKEGGKAARETTKGDGGDDLRTVVRPSGPASVEDTTRIANNLRERLKSVREREEQINTRQKELEVIYQDIRGERNVLDELRKQVADEVKSLAVKMDTVDRRFGDLEQKNQAITKQVADQKKNQLDMDRGEDKNIDKIGEMYNSMAPDAAARIL
jgi:DNA repair exonuclease SbcCD ATPase subunit